MSNLNIMVVDDSPEMRDILTQRFAAHGYPVVACENGDAAIAALRTAPVDVIITDLKMPGTMNGIQLLDYVKEHYPAIEVMIITGYAPVETAVEALRKGAVDYFIKPFNFEELLLWVQRIARKRDVLATLHHTQRNKDQGFSDLWGIIDSLYATCTKVEKILRTHDKPASERIEKALEVLSNRIHG